MKILTVTNLYPRPDQPARGLFNARLFQAMAEALAQDEGYREGASGVVNRCLVAEWRVSRWPRIRRWEDPFCHSLDTRYVPAFYVPLVGRDTSWWTYGRALRREEAAARSADVILATWLYPDGVAAARMGRRLGKRTWIKVHGTDRFHLNSPVRRRLILDATRYADGILSNCRFLRRELAEAGVAEQKIHVVRNGVDTQVFRFRTRVEALGGLVGCGEAVGGTPDKDRWVLFVGNLLAVKGVDLLIRAWMRIRAADSRLRLFLIGEGPLRGALEKLVCQQGVGDSVRFLGRRRPEDVALWLNAAACLCVPSRSEGMPNVVLEAMACGLPVVATDAGEVPSLLGGGERGTVVPAGEAAWRQSTAGVPDHDDEPLVGRLAEAMRDALAREWPREAMARTSGVTSWEQSARETLQCLSTSHGSASS